MVNAIRIHFLTAILLCFLFFNATSHAKETTEVGAPSSQSETSTPYYQGETKEGWWWYKDYQKSEKKEQEVKKEEGGKVSPIPTPVQPFVPKPLRDYTYEELLYMHPDEFSKVYDYYLKKAVQKPTEESIYEFYNLQDVARKKALLFTHYSGYVWQKYPELSTERDIPIAGPGITKRKALIREELSRYSSRNAAEFGYIVFVQPGCGYCEAQLKILKYAEADGIPVKVVDITRNPAVKERFGIEITPTIIVVDQKTGEYLPISAGVVTLDEIYTRTARAIRLLRGEDDPARYGIFDFQRGTSLDPLEPPPLWKQRKALPSESGQ